MPGIDRDITQYYILTKEEYKLMKQKLRRLRLEYTQFVKEDIKKYHIRNSIFNKPIDHLPNSITFLSLSQKFNLPVDYLPSSIQYLFFGYRFNQRIDYLPPSLLLLLFLLLLFNGY